MLIPAAEYPQALSLPVQMPPLGCYKRRFSVEISEIDRVTEPVSSEDRPNGYDRKLAEVDYAPLNSSAFFARN
jgi:hypothetical protein